MKPASVQFSTVCPALNGRACLWLASLFTGLCTLSGKGKSQIILAGSLFLYFIAFKHSLEWTDAWIDEHSMKLEGKTTKWLIFIIWGNQFWCSGWSKQGHKTCDSPTNWFSAKLDIHIFSSKSLICSFRKSSHNKMPFPLAPHSPMLTPHIWIGQHLAGINSQFLFSDFF